MPRKILVATLVLMLATVVDAGAKGAETLTQNEFMTAESLDSGMSQIGVFFSSGDGYRSFYPSFRYGLGSLFEVGIRGGVSTIDTGGPFSQTVNTGSDNKAAMFVGGDIKYQLVKSTEGVPVDMALDLGLNNHFIGGNATELTFQTTFSRSFPLTDVGYKITPYGGLEVSALYGSGFPKHGTDYYVFAGAEWKMSQKSLLYLEIKTGAHTVAGLGIRFEY